jgi:hypothetical protein
MAQQKVGVRSRHLAGGRIGRASRGLPPNKRAGGAPKMLGPAVGLGCSPPDCPIIRGIAGPGASRAGTHNFEAPSGPLRSPKLVERGSLTPWPDGCQMESRAGAASLVPSPRFQCSRGTAL